MRCWRRASGLLLGLWFACAGLSCRSSIGAACEVGSPDTCGRNAVCVGEGQQGRCVRAYDTDAELWLAAADNVGQTVVVRHLTLAPARRVQCTSKYCGAPPGADLAAPGPNLGQRFEGAPACIPCNACSVAIQPRNSDFRFMRSPDGRALECTGNDCAVDCPPYLAGFYELVARVEPAGESYGLSHVQLIRNIGARRHGLDPGSPSGATIRRPDPATPGPSSTETLTGTRQ